jgi:hypothetical protein
MKILTWHTHEGYQYELAKTGHQFYHLISAERVGWSTQVRPKPANVHDVLLKDIDVKEFDLLLTQSVGQWMSSAGWPVRHRLHLEHTAPGAQSMTPVTGKIVFITNFSRLRWMRQDAQVIHHGLDPLEWEVNSPTIDKILGVCNQFKKREWCCNYSGFAAAVKDLPFDIKGHGNEDIPGDIKGSESWADVKGWYKNYTIFLNSATCSPVPMVLLEAMASGMPVVSWASCEVPFFIRHGIDGLLVPGPAEARASMIYLMANPGLRKELGKNARATIASVCNIERFKSEWNRAFEQA